MAAASWIGSCQATSAIPYHGGLVVAPGVAVAAAMALGRRGWLPPRGKAPESKAGRRGAGEARI